MYAMISRIIKQQTISAVLTEDRKNWHNLLTYEEFTALSSVLEPFLYLTDALSVEKTVSFSAIRPVMKHIADVRTTDKDTDSRFIKEIKHVENKQ